MRSPPPATARPGSRAKASKRRPFSRPRRLPQGEHACGRPTARVGGTSISCSPTVTPGPRVRAEQVTDPVAYHGEGPVWSERWGGLRWVTAPRNATLEKIGPHGPEATRDHGVLIMQKLIATVFNYSLDGLLADEGTDFWTFCFELPENRQPDDPA